jgi:glycosyltransferase involved in cell wall biosynthesis/SAM-dependent methyltransferase
MLETDVTQPDSSSMRRPRARESARGDRPLAARFDALAATRDRWKARNAYYYRSIEALCRRFIPPGSRVLELGCGTGDLLAALSPDPKASLGIDISPETVARARPKHPGLAFAVGDAEALELPAGATYDFIVASDLVGHLDDVYATFRGLRAACHPGTRLVVTYYNFLWEGVLQVAERLGWKMPQGYQNWLGMQDLENLLLLGDFRVAARGWELLLPKRIPVVSDIVNAAAPHVPGLRHLCLVQYAVADVAPLPARRVEPLPRVSVVVPCRNEEGNIDRAVERIPEMGSATEILFVDGQSTDGTVARIEGAIARNRGVRDIRLIHQVPREGSAASEDPDRMLRLGKGDAVRKGFAAASGDIVMILDADLTVAPEDLPRFVEVLSEGKAQFVNGSRLVYPMEDESMRFANLCGNKAFSLAFTWLLGQPLKDTLCGTKALFREDYRRISADRAYFGDFDPFGDFDLLFGAARQRLRMVDMPVRYARRTAGVSKVRLVGHGWLLVRMSWIAFLKFKWNRWLGRDRAEKAEQ